MGRPGGLIQVAGRIAVGMAITDRPTQRSVRAELPHKMCSSTFHAVVPLVGICAGLCQERVPWSAMLYQR